VQKLEKVLADCAAAGHRRENFVKGRYTWPLYLVALVDELKTYRVPPTQVLRVETALRDLFRGSITNAAPLFSLGEALARESLAEAVANATRDRLIDDPDCAVRLRTLDHDLSLHEAELVQARLVIQAKLAEMDTPRPLASGVTS